MKFYLANEGGQIFNIVAGREEAAQGGGHDIDDVIAQLDGTVQARSPEWTTMLLRDVDAARDNVSIDLEIGMPGFGDMIHHTTDDPELAAFQSDVGLIFPNAALSRLARACGGVNVRTAQKWLSGQIAVPADVLAYVASQKASLLASRFDQQFDEFISGIDEGLDDEVVAAHLARYYFEITSSKIE